MFSFGPLSRGGLDQASCFVARVVRGSAGAPPRYGTLLAQYNSRARRAAQHCPWNVTCACMIDTNGDGSPELVIGSSDCTVTLFKLVASPWSVVEAGAAEASAPEASAPPVLASEVGHHPRLLRIRGWTAHSQICSLAPVPRHAGGEVPAALRERPLVAVALMSGSMALVCPLGGETLPLPIEDEDLAAGVPAGGHPWQRRSVRVATPPHVDARHGTPLPFAFREEAGLAPGQDALPDLVHESTGPDVAAGAAEEEEERQQGRRPRLIGSRPHPVALRAERRTHTRTQRQQRRKQQQKLGAKGGGGAAAAAAATDDAPPTASEAGRDRAAAPAAGTGGDSTTKGKGEPPLRPDPLALPISLWVRPCLLWSPPARGSVPADDGVLVCASLDGVMCALSMQSGRKRWEVAVRGTGCPAGTPFPSLTRTPANRGVPFPDGPAPVHAAPCAAPALSAGAAARTRCLLGRGAGGGGPRLRPRLSPAPGPRPSARCDELRAAAAIRPTLSLTHAFPISIPPLCPQPRKTCCMWRQAAAPCDASASTRFPPAVA